VYEKHVMNAVSILSKRLCGCQKKKIKKKQEKKDSVNAKLLTRGGNLSDHRERGGIEGSTAFKHRSPESVEQKMLDDKERELQAREIGGVASSIPPPCLEVL